ncbi:MAG: hypothetical protein RID07_10445 [Lacipirellulaceae bacterium]
MGKRLRAFPKDLAETVCDRWYNLVGGEYIAPPCPPKRLLIELLETLYLAAGSPEEARYPQFNIVALPSGGFNEFVSGDVWLFENPRPLSVSEIHRLAPVSDIRKSAILVSWDSDQLRLVGLVDLGTSWGRARIGLGYRYEVPSSLLVEVDRPNRMRIYQGQYLVAVLAEGRLERHEGFELTLTLHKTARNGLKRIWHKIKYPEHEEPREFESFQFTAFWNVFAGIANSISVNGHGGSLIILPAGARPSEKNLRIKYRQNSYFLRDRFIEYMNFRHAVVDLIVRQELGENGLEGSIALAEIRLSNAQEKLIESIRFVAGLSGCDGAIVISEDLRVFGFGCEIRSELHRNTDFVLDVKDELRDVFEKLDPQVFGLRHRSAIKLISRKPNYQVLVVSQDGPITAVWAKNDEIFVKKGINLVNLNMPWA